VISLVLFLKIDYTTITTVAAIDDLNLSSVRTSNNFIEQNVGYLASLSFDQGLLKQQIFLIECKDGYRERKNNVGI